MEDTEAYYDDIDELWEEVIYFEGLCNCIHTSDEHDWGGCGVDNCECEAHWTE